jgi:hypothetical protein
MAPRYTVLPDHEIIYIEEYEDDLAAQLVKEADLTLRRVEMPRKYGRNSK